MKRLATVAMVLVASATAARAALIVSVGSVSLAPGQSGYVDVYVTIDPTDTRNASENSSVNTYAVGIKDGVQSAGAPGSVALTRDAVPTNTAGGTRAVLLPGAAFFAVTDYNADGSATGAVDGYSLNDPGDSTTGVALAGANGLGLMRVPVSVPADARRGDSYVLNVDTDFTSFSTPTDADGNSSNLDYLTGTGTITVTPEPASLGLLGVAAVTLTRRRRVAA